MSSVVKTWNLKASKVGFGFWIYLMSDLMLFATFFAAFLVLRNSSFGGPTNIELFSLPYVFIQTLLLLTSSFVCGLMMVALQQKQKKQTIILLIITLVLGFAFLILEVNEFTKLVHEGASWRASGFLSSYFALVGLHGLHILAGLLWGAVLLYLFSKRGITKFTEKAASIFSLFWHFLDIVWIFIFTLVYLLGRLAI